MQQMENDNSLRDCKTLQSLIFLDYRIFDPVFPLARSNNTSIFP